MQIPNLPHDNIYKFVAFAGLAILLLTPYYYLASSEKWRSELNLSIAEMSSLQARGERLKEKVADTTHISREDSAELAEISNRSFEIVAENKNLLATGASVDFLRDLAYVGMVLGSMFMGIGLYNWHVKIQRPQDELLKLQIAELRRKISIDDAPE